MKKSIKLIALAFVLALSIAMICGICVSAGGAEPKIVSKSAYFGDQTYLYFAVNDTSLAEGEELEVLLYTENPKANSQAQAFKAELSELV